MLKNFILFALIVVAGTGGGLPAAHFLPFRYPAARRHVRIVGQGRHHPVRDVHGAVHDQPVAGERADVNVLARLRRRGEV